MKLNVTLNEKASKAFQEIKKHNCMQTNSNMTRLLISREESRIVASKRHKVFLPNEIYDKAEKAANALNLTIDEYIDSVTEQLLKNPNEGLKHGKN